MSFLALSYCKSTLLTRGKHNDAQCVEFCFYWLNSAQFLPLIIDFSEWTAWTARKFSQYIIMSYHKIYRKLKKMSHIYLVSLIFLDDRGGVRGCATSPRPSHRGRRWIDSRRRYRGHSKLWKHRSQREPWQNLANHSSRRNISASFSFSKFILVLQYGPRALEVLYRSSMR